MTRALVTGASGFLGRQILAPLRAAGHQVFAAARRPPLAHLDDLASDGGPTWIACDLLTADGRAAALATAQPDVILHLAWMAEHGAFWESPLNDPWLAASLDLAARWRAGGGGRFVFAGTCAEYDWDSPALEDPDRTEAATPCAPKTAYGRAKLAFGRALADQGWDHAVGRIFFAYGAGEDSRRLVPSVAGALLRGEVAKIGPGTQIRDFMDSRDFGAAFVALAGAAAQGPIDVGSSDPVTIRAVAERIAALVGRPELLQVGALPPRAGEPPRLVAARRLAREVGFAPLQSLDQGLADMIAALRGEGTTP